MKDCWLVYICKDTIYEDKNWYSQLLPCTKVEHALYKKEDILYSFISGFGKLHVWNTTFNYYTKYFRVNKIQDECLYLRKEYNSFYHGKWLFTVEPTQEMIDDIKEYADNYKTIKAIK